MKKGWVTTQARYNRWHFYSLHGWTAICQLASRTATAPAAVFPRWRTFPPTLVGRGCKICLRRLKEPFGTLVVRIT